MTDAQNRAALDAVNGKKTRLFRPAIQNALGALLVVLVTTSSSFVVYLGLNTRDNSNDVADLKRELTKFKQEVKEFHKWPRFTRQHHKELTNPIIDDLSDLERDVEALENRVEKTNDRMAQISIQIAEIPLKLPWPFTTEWQKRILHNREMISQCGCFNGHVKSQ